MNLSFIINNALQLSLLAGVISIVYGIFLTVLILRQPRGDAKMNAIADAISQGANAFMRRQYSVIAVIGAVICAFLFYTLGSYTALGFAVGAVFSAIAGILGMSVA